MTNPEPRAHLRQFLADRWDATEMQTWSYYDMGVPRENIRIHLGQYDADTPSPELALFKSHSTPSGGTGAYGTDGTTGEPVQRIRNNIYVDAVAGTVDDCKGIGVGGEDYEPRLLAYELYQYCSDLITTYRPFQGYNEKSCLPGEVDGNFPDQNPDPEPDYRVQFRVRRFYDDRPPA